MGITLRQLFNVLYITTATHNPIDCYKNCHAPLGINNHGCGTANPMVALQ